MSDVPPPPAPPPPPMSPPPPPGMVFQPRVSMSSASVRPSYSGKAVTSVVLGIVGIVLCFTAIPAIVALIIGLIARSEIRHSGGRLIGQRMAATGIVLGVLGILFGVAFYVAAALGAFDAETRIAGVAEARAATDEVVGPGPVLLDCRSLGRLAQSEEHHVHTVGVAGSRPASPTEDPAAEDRPCGRCASPAGLVHVRTTLG